MNEDVGTSRTYVLVLSLGLCHCLRQDPYSSLLIKIKD